MKPSNSSSFTTQDFSLYKTITSGQFFNYHYKTKAKVFTIINGENIFILFQENNIVHFTSNNSVINERHIKNFLGLDFDTTKLDLFEDKIFQKAYKQHGDLRVMNTDLFQTIISFVCSSAANISKIQKNIQLISQMFGKYNKNYKVYSFPSPEQINSLEKLLECKVGYRAKYILQISEFFTQNPHILEDLYKYSYEQAHTLLCSLPGIGSKVANCICLYALKHYDAFPVDVWIKKILIEEYKFTGNEKQLEYQAKLHFGKLAGYYQQYLFEYIREKDNSKK
ncbi:MAG: DNA glycosylase [Candidatus Woesearchaeota archaeon]